VIVTGLEGRRACSGAVFFFVLAHVREREERVKKWERERE